MKIAIYTGSFNPWHKGHEDVLKKALQVFDNVYVAQGINPEKDSTSERYHLLRKVEKHTGAFVCFYDGFLKDCLKQFVQDFDHSICAVVRGLRNAQDLEYETAQQYWNEDLGIEIPTVYFITDRKLRHISSSAIRQMEKFKK